MIRLKKGCSYRNSMSNLETSTGSEDSPSVEPALVCKYNDSVEVSSPLHMKLYCENCKKGKVTRSFGETIASGYCPKYKGDLPKLRLHEPDKKVIIR